MKNQGGVEDKRSSSTELERYQMYIKIVSLNLVVCVCVCFYVRVLDECSYDSPIYSPLVCLMELMKQ